MKNILEKRKIKVEKMKIFNFLSKMAAASKFDQNISILSDQKNIFFSGTGF